MIEKGQTAIKEVEIKQLRLSIREKLNLGKQFVHYYQTSSRTGFGVEELFNNFLTKIIDLLTSK